MRRLRVMREIGVETGGSNVQFAINPANGRMTVIEMNPRVSRSSALASKATGFPIAKIAAKLAVGYTLDEIPNDITRKTPACFEPTIDYVVVKIPKWQFEKFPGADDTLGPQMKSVGEVMAIGRTFKEALMKAWRALETGKRTGAEILEPRRLTQMLVTPKPERLGYIRFAFERGMTCPRSRAAHRDGSRGFCIRFAKSRSRSIASRAELPPTSTTMHFAGSNVTVSATNASLRSGICKAMKA